MARAAYQNLSHLSFGPRKVQAKQVTRLSLKPVTAQGTEPVFTPSVPKPVGRTVLKLKTPLS